MKFLFAIMVSTTTVWWSKAFVLPSLSSSRFQSHFKASQSSSSSSSLSVVTAQNKDECDVLVLGSGPAARAIAYLLSAPQNKLDILLADSNYDKKWPPNYGVWEDEWQAICNAYQQEFSRKDISDEKCIDRRLVLVLVLVHLLFLISSNPFCSFSHLLMLIIQVECDRLLLWWIL